jgi:rhamnosyl/mannosyltransferase
MRDNCAQIAEFSEKVEIVPIGIDCTDMDTSPRCLDGSHVLFVGRLVEFKGVRYLVSAMRHVDAELTVVGDGPERESLERLAVKAGVESKVTFEGHVSDERLTELYGTANAFVLPSIRDSESFGIVQLEALKHGLPVINTSLDTGVPYVSVDGRTGYTVEPRDARGIADAIERLFDNGDRYRQFSENALHRVREKFDEESMIEETLDIYRAAGST